MDLPKKEYEEYGIEESRDPGSRQAGSLAVDKFDISRDVGTDRWTDRQKAG